MRTGRTAALAVVAAAVAAGSSAAPKHTPDVTTIVQRWTAANRVDFDAEPEYSYSERIRDDNGTKTYQVSILYGTPYKRLVMVNGKPLPPAEQQKEDEAFNRERAKRAAESPGERADRIADYQKDRERAHRILVEMPRAFSYTIVRTRRVNARTVYVLRATPRPGYDPPNVEAEVLTGMRGVFWIDTASYQLVRGTARVLHPVSIEGVLATIQPGAEFEIDQKPVGNGVWLPSHFEIRSRSSILFVFHHHTDEDRTYFDYRRVSGVSTVTPADVHPPF